MPWVFVLIWSTGFIVARFGMPHAPPFTFLTIRYALSIVCFLVWIRLARAVWPRGRSQWQHLALTGVLMHAGYLGGVWAAVKAGIGAGTVALLVGLQPVLTAIWISRSSRSVRTEGGPGGTPSLAAAIGWTQWAGLALGFGGLLLVVWRKLGVGEVTGWNLSLAVLALVSITTGTLYQKRHVLTCDVRTASTVQLAGALIVSLPLAFIETEAMRWNAELIGAMSWSVLGLTLGGSSLLYLLIQRGAATKVTSLLFLVPPCTASMAWPLFGETLSPLALAGMALTAIGVALVVR
jgi:drug/metabolite transporter (DMT)-like permease